MTMNELVQLGKEQGYLDYEMIETVLVEEVGLMQDQVQDIVSVFADLGINVRGRPTENEKG